MSEIPESTASQSPVSKAHESLFSARCQPIIEAAHLLVEDYCERAVLEAEVFSLCAEIAVLAGALGSAPRKWVDDDDLFRKYSEWRDYVLLPLEDAPQQDPVTGAAQGGPAGQTGASPFKVVPNPEWIGPHEDWFCACRESYGDVLRPASMHLCPSCRTTAPWMTWELRRGA
jgi:hypothetical protein